MELISEDLEISEEVVIDMEERRKNATVAKSDKEQLADALLKIIRPHYKTMYFADHPEFRRSLKGDEIEDILMSIHKIATELRKEARGIKDVA